MLLPLNSPWLSTKVTKNKFSLKYFTDWRGFVPVLLEYPNQPNYFVLGTDYEHYAVIYNCMEFDKPAHTEMLWILTRERVPQAEYVHAAEEIVKEHHFPTNALFPIDQRNCLANQYKTL